MAFLNKIYALLDIFKEEKLDYVVIVMKGNKQRTKASIFHNIANKEMKLKINVIINSLVDELRKIQ